MEKLGILQEERGLSGKVIKHKRQICNLTAIRVPNLYLRNSGNFLAILGKLEDKMSNLQGSLDLRLYMSLM